MDGVWGLTGWQWMFLLESVPAVLLAPVVLATLTDRPSDATWLQPDERAVARSSAWRPKIRR